MSNRLNKEREKKLQPRRMKYAKNMIENLGLEITFENENELQFMFKGSRINFFPYSGWATGKTIQDGRGLERLLNQLKKNKS